MNLGLGVLAPSGSETRFAEEVAPPGKWKASRSPLERVWVGESRAFGGAGGGELDAATAGAGPSVRSDVEAGR